MSGLIGGLISAAHSLTAQQAGVQVAGRNLANVNNPEYSRQRAILGERVTLDSQLGPIGNGVEALGITQIRDQFLDQAVTRESSQSAALEAQENALTQAQSNLGEQIDRSSDSASLNDSTANPQGISAGLNNFFNAFENFSASPTDQGAKQLLLEKSTLLANQLNLADTRLAKLQTDLTTAATSDSASANSLLHQIADLNNSIAQVEFNAPDAAVELRDQRQARLEQLSNFMDFTSRSIPGSHGQIQIASQDASGAEVLLVDKSLVLGGLTFDGTQLSGGSPSSTLGLQGGSIKGHILARDGAIQSLRDALKNTANQLTAGVNTAYAPTGANFFQSPPSTGLIALDPSLNFSSLKATATTNAGANEVASAIANLAQTTFSIASGGAINGTISGVFNQAVGSLGHSLASVTDQLADQQVVEKMINGQRDAVSSVSSDEEMADLMKFQRSYQASARVLRVMDELLDGLVNGLIR